MTAQCRRCPVLALCHGGCPKDRVGISADGEAGQNHLCEGCLAVFRETQPAMRWMAAAWRAGRAPAEVMAVRQGAAPGQRSGDVWLFGATSGRRTICAILKGFR